MTSNNLSVQIEEKRIQQDGIDIVYPQVAGLSKKEVEDQINQTIKDRVNRLITEQTVWPSESGLKITTMTQNYKIMLNKNGILSIWFYNELFVEFGAHSSNMARAVTIDLNTGEIYTLKDLFQWGTDYIITLNTIISQQFKERDIVQIREFNGITINHQDFYLTPNDLVIFFQMYEYTPRPEGLPEFRIPYQTIINYINEEGPIGQLYV